MKYRFGISLRMRLLGWQTDMNVTMPVLSTAQRGTEQNREMATAIPPLRLHCWINQDEKDASAQKSQVFRHIAAHKKLKRLQRTWNLRATTRLPTKRLQISLQDQAHEQEQLREEGLKQHQDLQRRDQSPYHFDTQFDGNVDPFNSLPIQRTLEIDGLLQFDRLCVIPCFHGSVPGAPLSPRYLQDELAIYGYLARLAFMRGRCTTLAEDYDLVLKMKAEAMERLRLNLPSVVLPRLSRAAAALMYAETWCRNYAAVSVHTQLLEMLNNRYGLDVEDLIAVLHSDVQRAALVLQTPEFNLSSEGLESMEKDWIPLVEVDKDLDPCLEGTSRWIVTEARTALISVDFLGMPETMPKNRTAASLRYFHVQGLLLNHYNSTSDLVEKYTVLTALYRIRRSGNIERLSLCKAVVFNAGNILLPRLQEHLTEVTDDPPNLRLWALFVGAVAGEAWFREEFKRHAQTMGFCTFSDVRAVLNGFEHPEASCSQAELFLLDQMLGHELEDSDSEYGFVNL